MDLWKELGLSLEGGMAIVAGALLLAALMAVWQLRRQRASREAGSLRIGGVPEP